MPQDGNVDTGDVAVNAHSSIISKITQSVSQISVLGSSQFSNIMFGLKEVKIKPNISNLHR